VHVPVLHTKIVQRTAEAVRFEVQLVVGAGGTYSILPVRDFIQTAEVAINTTCSITCDDETLCSPYESTAEECLGDAPIEPVDSPVTGTLSSGAWVVSLTDDAGVAIACETTPGMTARCSIPPRGASPVTYRVTAAVRELTQLQPFFGATYGEFTSLGLTFTGKAPTTFSRCKFFGYYHGPYSTTKKCTVRRDYVYIEALDQASATFGALGLRAKSSPSSTIAPTTPPSTPASIALPAIAWNAGNDDLPGPAH
jgi:hypothetical protein